MTFNAFKSSIEEKQPPPGLNPLLLSLWYDAKGDWEQSHAIVQDIDTKDAALIHAYLHRKEGDHWNADYWYGRAGARRPNVSLENEWNSLAERFLK